METNLETLQKEVREYVIALTDDGHTKPTFGDLYKIDALTKRAYLAGIEAARGCVPEEVNITPTNFSEMGYNLAREETLDAIEKLVEGV